MTQSPKSKTHNGVRERKGGNIESEKEKNIAAEICEWVEEFRKFFFSSIIFI